MKSPLKNLSLPAFLLAFTVHAADPQKLKQADARHQPVVEMVDGRQELKRLGQMLSLLRPDLATNRIVIRVQPSPAIINSKDLPLDSLPLIAGALNAVGHGLLVTEWDKERLQLEGPFLHDEMTAQLKQPGLIIKGNFVKYDERIEVRRRSAFLNLLFGKGKASFEPSMDLEFDKEWSELAFNLRVELRRQNVLMPQVQADTSAILMKTRNNQRYGLFILGSGGTLGGEVTRANGIHDASMRLVERATLILLGRMLAVPFWRCQQGGQVDDFTLEAIRTYFNSELPSDRRMFELQRLLELNGFPTPATGWLDESTRSAATRFLTWRGRTWNEDLAELWIQLMLAAPMPFEPLNLATDAPKEPGGVTVQFLGFPARRRDTVAYVLKSSVRKTAQITRDRQEPFVFHLERSGNLDQFAENFPSEWNKVTGCRCQLQVLDDHRVKVINLSTELD